MVAIGRPSVTRLDVVHRLDVVDRAAGDLPALLLVLTPVALLNVLVGIRPGAAPGPAEAEAVVGAGAAGAGPGEVGFLAQLGVVQAVAGAAWDSSLLQSARGTGLLAGLGCAALLWPVLRRLGTSGNAAATAVIVAGLGPLALRLQPSIDPGAVAAFWIALAAAVGFRTRLAPAGVVAVVAALAVAVVTTPVAAAGLVAAAAHALLGGRVWPWLGPAPRAALGGLSALAAVSVGAVAVLPSLTGYAVPGGSGAPLLPLLTVLGLTAAVLPRVWARRPELRAVAVLAVGWLACALVPGPARLTALLLAVPALAVLVGALVGDTVADGRAADPPSRLSVAAATAVTVALVSGVVTVLWPVAPPQPGSYAPLARWLNRELAEGVPLSAAPLDRAELIAAGVPATRFTGATVPAGAVTVVPAEAGCGPGGTPVVRMAAAAGTLSVCAADGRGTVAVRGGAGAPLADNAAVRLAAPARELLAANQVDDRLVTVLAGAAATQPIEIADFPVVPGESATGLRRVAVLTGVVRAVDVNGRPAASGLELYLNAQQPAARPDLRVLPDGRLVVHFRLPG